MRKHLKKEPLRRKSYYSNRLFFRVLKVLSIYFGKTLKGQLPVQYPKTLQFLQNAIEVQSIRNICGFSGRARGVFSCVNLSRMNFRKHARSGYISGFYKASW